MTENLFLINDNEQYCIAEKIIEVRNIESYSILSLDYKEPYLVNKFQDVTDISTWQDFGILDPTLNRYWLEEYKQIEKYALDVLQDCHGRIITSPHFLFGLVWKLGNSYYKFIDILDTFFKNHKFNTIFFDHRDNCICNLILSFARLNDIKDVELAI
ncbi:MAG: hypothetical protein GY845_32610 [Planctomycetes bacterium]|nr:hypothetical protein [Planctomycetota bacterium]